MRGSGTVGLGRSKIALHNLDDLGSVTFPRIITLIEPTSSCASKPLPKLRVSSQPPDCMPERLWIFRIKQDCVLAVCQDFTDVRLVRSDDGTGASHIFE